MLLQKPLVSFCITTYKREDFLRKTLLSLQMQTYQHFEVIVSDNDPQQSGRAVVTSFNDPRLHYYSNETNLGMVASFNRSADRSSGDYIVMIADDDPVYPDMLETLVGLMNQYPGYGMYLGGSNWVCEDPVIAELYNIKVGYNSALAHLPINTVRTYTPDGFIADYFNFNIFPAYLWSTGMVRRDVLMAQGKMPEYGTPFLTDYAFIAVMGAHSGCVTINKALGHQTVHLNNFGRAQNDQFKTTINGFLDYVTKYVQHVPNWHACENKMRNFLGVWTVTYLSFMYRYSRKFQPGDTTDWKKLESEIFSIPVMKPFRLKYRLKKYSPGLHDFLVKLKKKLR